MSKVTLLLIAACLLPATASAHGTSASFEQDVGAYRIDVGYDPPQPRAGDRMLLDFGTLWHEGELLSDFEYVWVRIEIDGTTVLATGIKRAEFGPTSLLYVIPEEYSGDMTMYVRYEGASGVLAEASFTLPVAPEPFDSNDAFVPAAGLLAGILLGAVGMFFFMKRRRQLVY